MAISGHRSAYTNHKASAKQRGIPFLLTYSQWLSIWKASGQLDKRGRLRNNYCMARFGDRGPYSINNVKIITVVENSREASRARLGKPLSAEHRAKISDTHMRNKYALGIKRSAETKAKIRAAKKREYQRYRELGLPTQVGKQHL